MEEFRLRTARLELIAATPEILRADRSERTRLPGLLGAELPGAWPPPLNDDAVLTWMIDYNRSHPDATGWSMWYIVLASPRRTAIGTCGFKGSPTPEGSVELGYSLLAAYQGKGLATEAARELVRWAFGHPQVRRVIAETYPHLRNSIRVLEKNGFSYIGEGAEMLTIRFGLTREEWQDLNAS